MPNEPADPSGQTWREKLMLAAVRGAIAGAIRAIIIWAFEHWS